MHRRSFAWLLGLALCVTVLPVPAAAAPKQVVGCQTRILKEGARLVESVAQVLDRCARARLKCFTDKPGKGCDGKAAAACGTKMSVALNKADGRFILNVVKACLATSTSELLDAEGLDFLRQEAECSTRFGLPGTTRAGIFDCAAAHYRRSAELLFSTQMPRAREMLVTNSGVDPATVRHLIENEGLGGPIDGAVLACAKELSKQGRTFAKAITSNVDKCLHDVLKCTQLRPGDDSCLSKVATRCRKAAGAIEVAQAKVQLALGGGACTDVTFPSLQSPNALNLIGLRCECDLAGVPGIRTLNDQTRCLTREHECRLADVFRATMPSADALLEAAGLTLGELVCAPAQALVSRQPRLGPFGQVTKIFSLPGTPPKTGRAPSPSPRGNNFFGTVNGGRRPAPTSRGPFGPVTKIPRFSAVASATNERAAIEIPSQQSVVISVQGLNGEKVDGFLEISTPPCTMAECPVDPITLDYTENFGSCPLEPVFALKSVTNGVTEISPYVPMPQVPEPLLAGRGAGTILLPFDATTDHVTQLILHRIGDQEAGVSVIGKPLAAHVVFYDEGGAVALDGVVCLPANGSAVLDPADLSNLRVNGGSPAVNLSGERGLAVVTAYEADVGPAGTDCLVLDSGTRLEALLAGSWTITSAASFSSNTGDAIAIRNDEFPPDSSILENGLFLSTFNPLDLQDSQILLLGIEPRALPNGFSELGPIPARGAAGASACCAVRFYDNIADETPLPDFCFGPIGYASLDPFGFSSDPSIIPEDVPLETSGQLVFDECVSFDENGVAVPVGDAFPQFLFAFLGETVGPFSTGAKTAKYSEPVFGAGDGVDQPPQASTGVLVMPFNALENHASFQIVTTRAVAGSTGVVGTHWAFWSEDGTFLDDVTICLEPFDVVVTDVTALQSQNKFNENFSEVANLSGTRGFVVVTAYDAPDLGPSGHDCTIHGTDTRLDGALLGNWLLANTADNSTLGGDALGFDQDFLPDTSETGRSVFTLDPDELTNSQVFTVGLQLEAGPGEFVHELGPIPQTSAALAGGSTCCQVDFVPDGSSDGRALPTHCFVGAGFHPVADGLGIDPDVPLVPPAITLGSAGYIRFRDCVTRDSDGSIGPLGEGAFDQAFFVIHNFNSFEPF